MNKYRSIITLAVFAFSVLAGYQTICAVSEKEERINEGTKIEIKSDVQDGEKKHLNIVEDKEKAALSQTVTLVGTSVGSDNEKVDFPIELEDFSKTVKLFVEDNPGQAMHIPIFSNQQLEMLKPFITRKLLTNPEELDKALDNIPAYDKNILDQIADFLQIQPIINSLCYLSDRQRLDNILENEVDLLVRKELQKNPNQSIKQILRNNYGNQDAAVLLERIKDLHLENNQLTTLPKGVFNGSKSLQTLDLRCNKLTGSAGQFRLTHGLTISIIRFYPQKVQPTTPPNIPGTVVNDTPNPWHIDWSSSNPSCIVGGKCHSAYLTPGQWDSFDLTGYPDAAIKLYYTNDAGELYVCKYTPVVGPWPWVVSSLIRICRYSGGNIP